MMFAERIKRWDEGRVLTELDIRLTKLRRPELDERTPKARRLHVERLKLSERLVELRNLPLKGMEIQKRVNLEPVPEAEALL